MSGFPRSNFPPSWGSGEARPPSVFPPAAQPSPLGRQLAMAKNRVAEQTQFDDTASAAGSSASWSVVNDGVPFGKAPPPGFGRGQAASSIPEGSQAGDDSSADLPEIPADVKVPPTDPVAPAGLHFSAGYAQQGMGPANQAAKHVLDSKTKQTEKLEKQMARAKAKGYKQIRWGSLKPAQGNHARSYQLPAHIQQMGTGPDERSVLIIDSRDQRMASPFQGWLMDEILLNAQSGISVNADRALIRSPSSGYHLSLFYNRTLDGYKLTILGSMTSYTSVPCASWDEHTADVVSHPAFQPFRWPAMREDSSTWADLKFKIEGELVLHLELRGYKSDQDMSVQLNYINDGMIMAVRDHLFVPACVVTLFQGWRVVATSFEVGGRLYACSSGGQVMALDYPMCHFEVRMTAISSVDSIALDADKIEFRFCSAGDRLDVSCSNITVPSTWMVISRLPGPTLVQNAKWCRQTGARVEGPDQVMQLSQIAGIHAHWTAATEARDISEVGPRVGAVDVSSHESNFHLVCEAPLFKMDKALVPKSAIALQYHDIEEEEPAMLLPPIAGGPAAIPVAQAPGNMKALVGPQVVPPSAGPLLDSKISITEGGMAPEVFGLGERTIVVPRRSMEARLGESMSAAAITPADFVAQVQSSASAWPARGSTSSVPKVLGPGPIIEPMDDSNEV